MNFKEQQERFDLMKWQDGIAAGCDQCGAYPFCSVCNKEEEYPCARAAYRYKKKGVRIATVQFVIGEND